ncbi:hypothetical protein [Pasteurella multocida]|uniref:hypothetical protein n=1 Tax=Pasteurella multocida TaxID=747 RepID=UPI0035F49F95
MEGMILVILLIIASLIVFLVFGQTLAAVVILCLAFWLSGWIFAHNKVADECNKLGKFYIGKTVYECTAIKEEKND